MFVSLARMGLGAGSAPTHSLHFYCLLRFVSRNLERSAGLFPPPPRRR